MMNTILAILLWILYSIITILIVANAYWRWFMEWQNFIALDLLACLLSFFGVLIYVVAAFQFGSFKRLSGMGDAKLIMNGLYKYSRNPQFLGWWLFLGGIFILHANILSLFLWSAGIVTGLVQIVYEEEQLRLKYGKQYVDYRHEVRRIF